MGRIRFVAVAIVAVIALAGCDWAQFGFGPDHTNANPSEPALTPASVTTLKQAWSNPCFCETPPLVAGGLVYIAEPPSTDTPHNVVLDVRDAATGAARWSTTFNHVNDARFVGIANGLAYVRVGSNPVDGATGTGSSDVLIAFDATTGAFHWSVVPPAAGPGEATIVSWLVDGGRVLLATSLAAGDVVSAIDSAGHVVWSARPAGRVEGVVADPGRTLHVVSFVGVHPDGTGVDVLTSYAEPTGALTAQRFADFGPRGLESGSPLSFANGLVYADSNANTLPGNHLAAVAVRVATGVQAWNRLDEAIAAVGPGAVITAGSGLIARNPTTGATLWSHSGGTSTQFQSAAIASGMVFADAGGAGVFRLSDGFVLALAIPNGGQITVSGGRVFAADLNGLRVFAPTS